MTRASCASRIERALKKTDGVLEANVNLATERASVTYAPGVADFTALKNAVETAGYGVIEPAREETTDGEDVEAAARRAELADKRRKLIVAVAFGLPLFLLAMARDFGLISCETWQKPWRLPLGSCLQTACILRQLGVDHSGVLRRRSTAPGAGASARCPARS